MRIEEQENRPYLDWSLDRLKIGLVLLLFIALIVAPFLAPLEPSNSTQVPVQPAGVAAAPGSSAGSSSPPQSVTSPTGAAPGSIQENPPESSTDGAEIAANDMAAQMPLTLAQIGPNAVVLAQSLSSLEGTAAPGKLVEIRVQYVPAQATSPSVGAAGVERVLGTSLANNLGLWTFATAEEFAPGQYVVTLRQMSTVGQIELVSSPVVVTVLSDGEVGPPSLATPTLRFPSTAAQLRHGPLSFDGTGLPGARLQLYVNNRLIGETLIGRDAEWQLTVPDGLPAGVYIAQVATLDPQGDVMAESAPAAFAVVDAPLGVAPSFPSNNPLLPLRLSEARVAERPSGALVLTGVATPHSSVAAWVDGLPIQYTNTRIDGGWRLWFLRYYAADDERLVEVRTHLSEVIQIEQTGMETAVEWQYEPVFIFPTPGEILTTRRPLLLGVAPPRTEISLLVNSVLVASVVTDEHGRWAYQVESPLPSGRVALTAILGVSREAVGSDADEDGVTVTIAPKL